MSKDALEGYWMVMEDEQMEIPKPSTYQALQHTVTEGQALQLVAVSIQIR